MDRNIVFIHGSEVSDTYSIDVQKLWHGCAKRGANVFSVGDGRKDISVDEIVDVFNDAFSNGIPTTVIIDGHFVWGSRKHRVFIGESAKIETEDLFTLCAMASFGSPCDVFMLSCKAAKALPYTNVLSPGSSVAAPCSEKGFAHYLDIENWADALNDDDLGKGRDLSALNLLRLYLVSADYLERPSYAVSDNIKIDSKDLLRNPPDVDDLAAVAEDLQDFIHPDDIPDILERLKNPVANNGSALRWPYRGMALTLAMEAALRTNSL